jgi:hypothetical protein
MKKIEEFEFDEMGNYTRKKNLKISNQNITSKFIRLKSFEYIYKGWTFFGKDTRFHITAISGCVVCFLIIFYTGLAAESRLSNYQIKSTLNKDISDKKIWYKYIQNKYGLDYDPSLYTIF